MTEQQMIAQREARFAKEWGKIAGEAVEVEQIGGAVYAFGSELATLRLYRQMPNGRQGFSGNLGKWYFRKELMV